MKTAIYLIFSVVILASCNGTSSNGNSDSALTDSPKVVKIIEPPKPKRDSISMDIANSKFNCTRSKTVKDVDKVVKLFGADVNVKMDNASFSTDVVINILNGSWFSLDKKFDGGKVVLDMTSIAAVQVGKNNELEMASPEYLDVKKYPNATLFIDSLNAVNNDLKKLMVIGRLQLKDKTEPVEFPATVKYGDDKITPSKLTGDFHINGIEWGLNPKNAKVTKDDLLFHVVLVTEKK